MQIVMSKCFLLNHENNLAQVRLVVFEKNAYFISKNDVTEPKAAIGTNQLMVSRSLKLSLNLLRAFSLVSSLAVDVVT